VLARIAGPIAGLLGPISRNWGCIEEAKGIKLIPPPSGGGRGYAPDPIKEKKNFFSILLARYLPQRPWLFLPLCFPSTSPKTLITFVIL
jgi:hypothetical protein